MASFPTKRLRRLRTSATLREMLAETRLSPKELIAPLFVREGDGPQREIGSMPGQFQHSVDTAVETVRRWADVGLPAVLLFGIADRKDATGSAAWDDAAAVQQLCRQIKRALPQVVVITDVCLCEYTDHGHCGPLSEGQCGAVDVDNDATLELLAKVAVSHARSGADIVAPSAMMDGQVAAVRGAMDAEGFANTAIMSYAVKFASSLYGPFREAAASTPSGGDRRGYQMDPANARQAIQEIQQDIIEGADIVMVKPALAFLDIICRAREQFDCPIAAYNVSGEYMMLNAAADAGLLDRKAAIMEMLSSFKRAGADIIITYFAKEIAGNK